MQFNKLDIQLRIIMVCVALSCANLSAMSQLTDYGYMSAKTSWLVSENPTGINALDTAKISLVEIELNKGNGKFKNYHESDNCYEYGILTESYYRLSPKTVVYGKIVYSNFEGKNMGASTSINPYYNPFDIVEFADSTAGTKKKETYYLVGTLSTKLNNHFLLGLHVDYKNISYYKIKDLRHTNDFMDLNVKGGLQYIFSKNLETGIHYAYSRSTEGISFQSVGDKDQQFNSLISYGAFFGQQERFGESGYTQSADNKPYFNEYHTVGWQVNLFPRRKISVYNEVSASLRSGYYGKNSSTSVLYTEHKATLLHYKTIVSLKTQTALHKLQLDCNTENLENNVNIFKEETTAGGNTVTVYYGQNKVLERTTTDLTFGYTGNFGIKDNNPSWEAKAMINSRFNNKTVTIYPAYRKQAINEYTATLTAGKNVFSGNSTYTGFLEATYAFGTGYAAKDAKYDNSSSTSVVSIDRYLYREYEYLTAKRMNGKAGFRYTKALPAMKLKLFTELAYGYTQAFSVNYIGNTYGEISAKVGCQF
jgi:hypothetical protein